MSNNPNYRPSDPPQVGSQQFNNNYGSQPQYGQGQSGQYGSGAGQYGSGAGQYGSGAGQHSQGQPYGQQNSYGQSDPYGQQNGYGQSGAYSQPNAYDAYGQPGAYSQPMTYGAQPVFVRPAPNKMAVWSMWMGIAGIGGGFVCGLLSMIPVIGIIFSIIAMFLWIAPVLAVIFGHIGLGQIKRTGEEGRGPAIAGLIIGYVTIALGLIMAIVMIGILGIGFLGMMSSY
ncbi:DUF4190 domain-containing protein [Brevibacterium sp. JSBI002]|uniref:DUF4190 domain-containing protein n=1 Tax=Brevibacterium sp. JSBI002 TaxID=2886045 RepID=UPI002230098F|nr:DUF4190 domain-containing protein [Brevibacterium sp. JSBI002]UZD61544.1 DUF4190 domain-containing protein [Brevibacterium sp. JSBI002]